jgi:hypothetical protein
MNDKILKENKVTGFLLGLGIGLVVGIIFQPRVDGYPRGFESSKSRGLGGE